jgi:hypothetical protein
MYYVIDFYEGIELIGTYKTLAAAKRACIQQMTDTDGECATDYFFTENKDDMEHLKNWGLI